MIKNIEVKEDIFCAEIAGMVTKKDVDSVVPEIEKIIARMITEIDIPVIMIDFFII